MNTDITLKLGQHLITVEFKTDIHLLIDDYVECADLDIQLWCEPYDDVCPLFSREEIETVRVQVVDYIYYVLSQKHKAETEYYNYLMEN